MSMESGMLSNPLILCHPVLLFSFLIYFLFSFCLQSFPASESFSMSWLFASGGWSTGASASASVLSMNIQDWFPLCWLVGSLCSPRNFQESSPTLQFKNINSSVLSLLYGPTLTSIYDYWKNNSFDYTDLCWQSNVSAYIFHGVLLHISSAQPSPSLHSSLLCTAAAKSRQSCQAVFNPMDCSIPGFPVLHCLLEYAQTHVHWVSDAI